MFRIRYKGFVGAAVARKEGESEVVGVFDVGLFLIFNIKNDKNSLFILLTALDTPSALKN